MLTFALRAHSGEYRQTTPPSPPVDAFDMLLHLASALESVVARFAEGLGNHLRERVHITCLFLGSGYFQWFRFCGAIVDTQKPDRKGLVTHVMERNKREVTAQARVHGDAKAEDVCTWIDDAFAV